MSTAISRGDRASPTGHSVGRCRLGLGIVVVLGLLLGSTGTALAGAFLRIQEAPGESVDPAHLGWIDLTSVQNTVTNPSPTRAIPGTTLRLVKPVDRATPRLLEAICRGTLLPSAELEWTRPGAQGSRFHRIVLENVRLSAQAVAGGNGLAVEQLTLDFERAQWTYTEFSATGSAVADDLVFWDFVRNEGGSSRVIKGFTVKSVIQSDGRLGVQWTPEPGRSYSLLRSSDPAGPYQLVRKLGTFTDASARWAELPTGTPFDFFLVREDE